MQDIKIFVFLRLDIFIGIITLIPHSDFWHYHFDGARDSAGKQAEIADGGNDLFDGGNKIYVSTQNKQFQVCKETLISIVQIGKSKKFPFRNYRRKLWILTE